MYRYYGSGPEEGTVVDENHAYDYALERCLHGTEDEREEFKAMLEEWYYSNGDWSKKEDWEIEAGI